MQIVPINIGPITNASGFVINGSTTAFSIASGNVYAMIQNISSVDMYLGINFTPSLNNGILLKANGGAIEFNGGFIPSGTYFLWVNSATSCPYTAFYA